jgi:hypothetical protein
MVLAMKATGQCRSCKADVIWVTTEHGKHMPVDAKPVPGGDFVVTLMFGGPRARYKQTDDDPAKSYFTSHFATCPDANKWRNQKPRKANA